MPQIGWFEIVIIVVLSIIIIGPKDFPIVLKKIGGWMGSIKRYFNEIQKDICQNGNPKFIFYHGTTKRIDSEFGNNSRN